MIDDRWKIKSYINCLHLLLYYCILLYNLQQISSNNLYPLIKSRIFLQNIDLLNTLRLKDFSDDSNIEK